MSRHKKFTEFEFRAGNGHRGIGTHQRGNDDEKIDYILLSPALFSKVTKGGIFRKGAWPGTRPRRWDVYPDSRQSIKPPPTTTQSGRTSISERYFAALVACASLSGGLHGRACTSQR